MRSAFAERERSLVLRVVTAVCSIFIKQELDEPWELSMSGDVPSGTECHRQHEECHTVGLKSFCIFTDQCQQLSPIHDT